LPIPLLLYVRGNPALLAGNALAVVGSRNATAQGVQHAGRFSEEPSRAGITIVSGLALGIDAAAHAGGLAGPGSTVAVIGTGIDLIIPSAIARWHSASPRVAASSVNMRWARRRWRPTSTPQPPDLGLVARRAGGGSGSPIGVAHHRAHGG
jgi:hypothetical protein